MPQSLVPVVRVSSIEQPLSPLALVDWGRHWSPLDPHGDRGFWFANRLFLHSTIAHWRSFRNHRSCTESRDLRNNAISLISSSAVIRRWNVYLSYSLRSYWWRNCCYSWPPFPWCIHPLRELLKWRLRRFGRVPPVHPSSSGRKQHNYPKQILFCI